MLWRRVIALLCVATLLLSGVAPAYTPNTMPRPDANRSAGISLSDGRLADQTLVLLFDRADALPVEPRQSHPTLFIHWTEAVQLPRWDSIASHRHPFVTPDVQDSRLHRLCRLIV